MAYFYGRLFAADPDLRRLFPLAMDRHRERFFRVLTRIVWSLDSPAHLVPLLAQLGRDHRRFGVGPEHYPEFTSALLATVREFTGPGWEPALARAWEAALAAIAKTMTEAAQAEHSPAWWLAEVIGHDRPAADLAVLTVRPDQPLGYLPGQYVTVQSQRVPREWRTYSVANAPRDDGILTLHVRSVPGGAVSPALVHHTTAGDTLLLGPAAGTMTLTAGQPGDLFCAAGGTGLAPVKAIIEQAAAAGDRLITLLYGARTEAGLYGLGELRRLARSCPALTVIPATSDDPGYEGRHGAVPDLILDRADWRDRQVYLCGPVAMVRRARAVLAELGAPAELVHFDNPDLVTVRRKRQAGALSYLSPLGHPGAVSDRVIAE